MRYILYTTPIKEPGSIGVELRANAFMGEDVAFSDLPKFDHWAVTTYINGWARFRQRRGHIQLAVDELIATGAQVCVNPDDATLVRWFTHRPLPTTHDYMLENLGPAHRKHLVGRYTFRPPAEYAKRPRMPQEVVIFASGSTEAVQELRRRVWYRDVSITYESLREWLKEVRFAGEVHTQWRLTFDARGRA